MEYKTFGIEELDKIKKIYESVNWLSYLKDDEQLVTAINNSLYLLGIFDGAELIGFARVLGDASHMVIIQDLVIEPKYQNQGLGKELFKKCIEKYKDSRMILVITDLFDERDNAFYQKFKMKKLESGQMVGYFLHK